MCSSKHSVLSYQTKAQSTCLLADVPLGIVYLMRYFPTKEYLMAKKRRKRRRYPKNWKQLAFACKELAGWQCEECHAEHLAERISKRTGLVYRMRLHAAHVGRYTKHPMLKALCPTCHGRLDWQLRKSHAEGTLEKHKHQLLLSSRK